MGKDALSSLMFVDNDQIWNGLEITFSGQPFRQLLEQLRQRPKTVLSAGLPRFVVIAIALILDTPIQVGAPGDRVDLLDEPVSLILRDVVLRVDYPPLAIHPDEMRVGLTAN